MIPDNDRGVFFFLKFVFLAVVEKPSFVSTHKERKHSAKTKRNRKLFQRSHHRRRETLGLVCC